MWIPTARKAISTGADRRVDPPRNENLHGGWAGLIGAFGVTSWLLCRGVEEDALSRRDGRWRSHARDPGLDGTGVAAC